MKHPKIRSGLTESEIEDYTKRLAHYIVSMCFFEKMLDNGELSIEDYIDIERNLLIVVANLSTLEHKNAIFFTMLCISSNKLFCQWTTWQDIAWMKKYKQNYWWQQWLKEESKHVKTRRILKKS